MLFSFRISTGGLKEGREVLERFEEPRLKLERATEVRDSLFLVVQGDQDQTQSVVELRDFSIERDGFDEQVARLGVMTCLIRDEAQQVKCIEVFRIGGEDLTIEGFSFRNLAALVEREGLLERLLDVGHFDHCR